MKNARQFRFWVPLTLTILVFLLFARTTTAQELSWDEEPDSTVALQLDGVDLWRFHYGEEVEKPYFHPIAPAGGPTFTADAPQDHPWHYGLWFSWKFINDRNYWEFNRVTGLSEGMTEWSNVRIERGDDFSATIRLDVVYIDADSTEDRYAALNDRTTIDEGVGIEKREPDQEPVLTESRLIEIGSPREDGCVAIDWDMTFTAGEEDVELDRTPIPGEPGGVGYGGYAGLSLRMAEAFTEREAVSIDGEIEFGDQNRYRGLHAAMDYSGVIEENLGGIAILDHPENPRHPSAWYVIRDRVMSYYSPAFICYEPYELKAGESFTLRYRVIAHNDRWGTEELETESEAYGDQ